MKLKHKNTDSQAEYCQAEPVEAFSRSYFATLRQACLPVGRLSVTLLNMTFYLQSERISIARCVTK
jgi:hypothetical protein